MLKINHHGDYVDLGSMTPGLLALERELLCEQIDFLQPLERLRPYSPVVQQHRLNLARVNAELARRVRPGPAY